MCGIYGRVSFSGRGSDVDDVAALRSLRHRGPDDEGWHRDAGVFLGMTRLSIIDLAGGHQPIWNENNTLCIVYNGELYNYRELREQLIALGHHFRTRTDTEVVLHAFEQWGADCLSRFNGMFALAIWNTADRILFLARDRVGEKPLFYRHTAHELRFASEIKAIIADPEIQRDVNPIGLRNFLGYGHSMCPDTMFSGIRKLPAGHWLQLRDGTAEVREYWDVNTHTQAGPVESNGDVKNAIIELLRDSVQRRMIADVPVGAFLSGGVDSSAVVALMTQTGAQVKTFSLGFDAGTAYNELDDARRVAKFLGTDHHELFVRDEDLTAVLNDLVNQFDEPFGDAAAFPLFLLSRFARQHVKVVLAGDGGDELFGGYRRYVAEQGAPVFERVPRWLLGTAAAGFEQMRRFRRLKRTARAMQVRDPALRYPEWLVVFTPEMQAELLSANLATSLNGYDPAQTYAEYYRSAKGQNGDHLNRLMYVDLKTWLADTYLEKTDKTTMAASLEARLPLLDHRLVELAFKIPSRKKIKGFATKRVFKAALSGLVPADVLNKPKHGFSVPTDPWFRGPLRDFAFEVLLDDRTRRHGYFNQDFVHRLWREHREGRHVWDTQLWLLMNFELWHRAFMDRAAA